MKKFNVLFLKKWATLISNIIAQLFDIIYTTQIKLEKRREFLICGGLSLAPQQSIEIDDDVFSTFKF